MIHNSPPRRGLTLMEILVSMAILVVLLAIGIKALNPVGQFKSARNTQRNLHVMTILNAIRQNVADTRSGIFTCGSGDIPTSSKRMAIGVGNYDIAPCLVPNYMNNLPFDPSATSSYYTSVSDYNAGYNVMRNVSGAVTVSITVSAPFAELGKTISVTR